jgi:hypothetical protein
MAQWQPATREEVQAILDEDLRDCSPEVRATFDTHRVPLRQAPIVRYGNEEHVYIVAQRDDEVLYWEDVDEGFNFSRLDEDGRIVEHWCNQDSLSTAMQHWMGHPQQERCGPAEPIPSGDAS